MHELGAVLDGFAAVGHHGRSVRMRLTPSCCRASSKRSSTVGEKAALQPRGPPTSTRNATAQDDDPPFPTALHPELPASRSPIYRCGPMPAPDLSHRRARPGDDHLLLRLIAAYYAFDHIAFDESVAREGLAKLLADDGIGRVYLLEVAGEVAGYVLFTFAFDIEFGGRIATITDFYLEPRFRRAGLGIKTLAVAVAHEECRRLDVRAIELQVEEGNLPAQALYRRFGFKRLSRLPLSKQL